MSVNAIVLRYPDFKHKAVTFSYDDDVIFNKRLMEMFDKYGVKATFNLNGGMFAPVTNERKVSAEDAVALLKNTDHEVAMHGYKHFSLASTNPAAGCYDILKDKETLEKLFDRIINGLAYGNGSYNKQVVEMLRAVGVNYARTIDSTHGRNGFGLPEDFLAWHPTCAHRDADIFDLLDRFFEYHNERPFRFEPSLFYIWGHSYEFNDRDNWDLMERILEKIDSHKEELFYCTNGWLYNYFTAYKRLEYSLDRSIIYNPTQTDIYLLINNEPVIIKAGETLRYN